MLLTWMGTDERQMKNGVDDPRVPLEVPVYKLTKKISNATTENNPRLRNFMATKTSAVFNANSDTKRVSINDLGTVMTRRSPPVGDFAARYSRDDKYKDLVVAQLRGIFEQDVVAMSLNPVFGSLWRAVCNERGGRDRDVLAPIFGYHVGRIQNTHKKAQMKAWLDNSYDYSLAIEKEVGEVAAEHMYPMVFLDPTVEFAGREPGQRDENLRRLERSELLERYLENPVEAKVNWHPDKSQAAVGPLVTCRECKFPRSVTVMGEKGVCGMCCAPSADCCCVACTRPEGIDAEERLCANVTREDTEASRVPLVECAVRDCRAQYVMYNPARLRVWAKCFYCRHAGLRGWQDGGGAWKGALCRVQPVPRQDDLASRVPPAGIQPRDLQVSRLRVRRADGRLAGDDAAADGGGERLGVATQERGRGYPAAVQQPVHLLHGQPLRSAKHLCKGGAAPLV
ncbi:hypothetical protein J3458_000307 [Metarhizium acridum]|uniref:uncharacterized protein n=1 Tax=Metarhizium acridum TaxID=92637 RepID=UPI001C6D0842|nr:hypothetical protein J3458_000307 [Metarhizium acridum]